MPAYPYVLIDAYDAPDDASSVTVDHVQGVGMAVRHLRGCGYTRIAFAGSDPKMPSIAMMLAGYRKAMVEAGLRIEPGWISEEPPDIGGGASRDFQIPGAPRSADGSHLQQRSDCVRRDARAGRAPTGHPCRLRRGRL